MRQGEVHYVEEPLRHFERPGKRVLDLRPHGVSFVPTLSLSNPPKAMAGPSSLHVHKGCVEIVYCVRGAHFHFETPGRNYPFLPGTVFVSRDTEPHRLSANPNGHFVYRILVELQERFEGLDKSESKWLRNALISLPRCFRVAGNSVRIGFEQLFASYDDMSDPVRRRVLLRMDVYALLKAVIVASERSLGRHRDSGVAKWVDEISRRPEEPCDFRRMCGETKLPSGVFARRFAEIAGLPPQAYRNACRIRKACRMLDRGLGVTDVAAALGFCSSQYFTTVFKRETGMTPTERKKGNA